MSSTSSNQKGCVFISYSRQDKPFVDRLCSDLKMYHIPYWMDRDRVGVGSKWEQEIRNIVPNCCAVVFVASPASGQSVIVQSELSLAKSNKIPIFPIWKDGDNWIDCVPFEYSNMHYIDMRDNVYIDGLAQLISSLIKNSYVAPAPSKENKTDQQLFLKDAEKLSSVESVRKNPNLYDFLGWKYNQYNVLKRCNTIYPVVTFPAPEHQQCEPNSILKRLDTQHNLEASTFDDTFFELLKASQGQTKRILNDWVTFTMLDAEIQNDGTIKLSCGIGSYFKLLQTCRALEYELLQTWRIAETKPGNAREFFAFDKNLKLRNKLHQTIDNPLINGGGRSAAISISTLIVFTHNDHFHVWFYRRSEHVATCAGMLHVIPAGIFQPTTSSIHNEFDDGVVYNVHKEYLEELFSFPEPGELVPPQHHRYIYSDSRLWSSPSLVE